MEQISRCEEEVLLAIFELKEEAALQQVMCAVNKKYKHDWKPQTVSTFFARLVKKGIVVMTRKGRYCYYTPVMSLEEYRIQSMKERVEVLFNGDVEACKMCLEMMR